METSQIEGPYPAEKLGLELLVSPGLEQPRHGAFLDHELDPPPQHSVPVQAIGKLLAAFTANPAQRRGMHLDPWYFSGFLGDAQGSTLLPASRIAESRAGWRHLRRRAGRIQAGLQETGRLCRSWWFGFRNKGRGLSFGLTVTGFELERRIAAWVRSRPLQQLDSRFILELVGTDSGDDRRQPVIQSHLPGNVACADDDFGVAPWLARA